MSIFGKCNFFVIFKRRPICPFLSLDSSKHWSLLYFLGSSKKAKKTPKIVVLSNSDDDDNFSLPKPSTSKGRNFKSCHCNNHDHCHFTNFCALLGLAETDNDDDSLAGFKKRGPKIVFSDNDDEDDNVLPPKTTTAKGRLLT